MLRHAGDFHGEVRHFVKLQCTAQRGFLHSLVDESGDALFGHRCGSFLGDKNTMNAAQRRRVHQHDA